MPELRWTLVDLDGASLGPPLLQTTTGEVTINLSDARTAQNVVVSMFDEASAAIQEGDVVLKAEYGEHLAFQGVIDEPSDDFDAGTVTIAAQDPTLKAQHRNLRYGHASVTASLGGLPGVPVDGSGLRTILTDMDSGGGAIPLSGIQTGTDTVPAQPVATDPTAVYLQVTRGQLAWDVWQAMTGAASGFDFELNPVDARHPGAAAWVPGALVELNTMVRQGVDRSFGNGVVKPVVFRYGRELSNLVVAPKFSDTKNYAVQVIPGGQASPTDIGAKAGAFNHASWVRYGLMEDWQAISDQLDPAIEEQVLKDRALAVAMAYGTPPKYFTATAFVDMPGGLLYPRDFGVGDVITAVGKKGFRSVQVDGRIVSVTLGQRDQDGNSLLTVLCVPHKINPADISFD